MDLNRRSAIPNLFIKSILGEFLSKSVISLGLHRE